MQNGAQAVPSVREFGSGLRAQIERARELERQKSCRELLWAIEAQEFSARFRDGAAAGATLAVDTDEEAEAPVGELIAA